jgi:hypothetical protein
VTQEHVDARGVRVLRGVLDRLQAAEVDRRFGLDRLTVDAVGDDGHGDRAHARLHLECRGDASVLEDGRIDAQRQGRQGVDRLVHLGAQLAEHGGGAMRVLREHPADQPQLHGEGHKVLLCAVVDVSFEAPALGVLRRHDALSRGLQLRRPAGDLLQARLQLRGEPYVRQHEARLSCEVGQQCCLGGRHRLAARFRPGDGAQQLFVVPDLYRRVRARKGRQVLPRHRDRPRRALAGRPRAALVQRVADPEPDAHALRAGALGDHPRGARQDVLGGVRAGDPVTEP